MMSKSATATFEVKSWDEKPYSEEAGAPKLTRASVVESLEGDIAGEGKTEYLMAYINEDKASFVRLERVVGRLAGRSGSFLLQGHGTYADGTAQGEYAIVPGSGSGELKGLRGKGAFRAHREPRGTMTLEYDFE
jgi:hypothetical protein